MHDQRRALKIYGFRFDQRFRKERYIGVSGLAAQSESVIQPLGQRQTDLCFELSARRAWLKCVHAEFAAGARSGEESRANNKKRRA